MLFLVLRSGSHRYALEAGQVVGLLPLMRVETLPHMPPAFAGLINYGGRPVPVLDFGQLVTGQATPRRLSTRIVLVRHPASDSRLVGLMADRATEARRGESADFIEPGLEASAV